VGTFFDSEPVFFKDSEPVFFKEVVSCAIGVAVAFALPELFFVESFLPFTTFTSGTDFTTFLVAAC